MQSESESELGCIGEQVVSKSRLPYLRVAYGSKPSKVR